MAIFRGAGGPGDATTDAANEATVASTKAAEAEASATSAASSATAAGNSATSASSSATSASNSATSAASSATAAANSASTANAAKTNAETAETNAETAQAAAEAAQTAAETAETNASNSATAAATSATNASNSATAASTAQTAAETAQTAAETAETNAAASYDAFDDRYLGAKASAPTVDNDGDALLTGALYWDTGVNQLYVWNGSAWEEAAFSISGSVTSFNTRTGAVTLSATDVNTALGSDAVLDSDIGATVQAYNSNLTGINQGLATTDSPTFAGLSVSSSSTYAINVTRPTDGNTTLRINSGSTAGNDAIFRADIGNTTGTSAVYFGDTATNGIGRIMYEHNGDYMRFYTDSAERLRIDSSGNVGIGTTSPAEKLEVVGAARLVNTSNSSNNSDLFDGGGLVIRANNSNPIYFYTGGGEVARIDSSGNVGIGTTNPWSKLTVVDNVDISMDSVASGHITIDGNGYNFGIALDASGANLYTNSAIRDLIFGTNETERMRIDGSGNVGIGTTSPSVLLHLTSTDPIIRFTDSDTGADTDISAANSSGSLYIDIDKANLVASSNLQIDIDGSEVMRINSSGEVSIGTVSDTAKLRVSKGSSTNAAIIEGSGFQTYFGYGTNSDNYISSGTSGNPAIFRVGSTEVMRINNSGNVGIGTSNPLTALVTVGTTMATSQAFVGSVADTTYSGGIVNLSNSTRSIGITSDPTNAGAGSILNFSVDGSEHMRINSSGNVGIGTTNPIAKVHAYATSGTSSLRTQSAGSTGTDIGSVVSFAGSYYVQNVVYGSGVGYLTSNAPTVITGAMASGSSLRLYSNGSESARLDSSGDFKFNSGYGSAATAYGCRAWVNFNGTGTVAIRDSANVSSITDLGTGYYTVILSTAMPDANYSAVVTVKSSLSTRNTFANLGGSGETDPQTNYFRVLTMTSTNVAFTDTEFVMAAVFR